MKGKDGREMKIKVNENIAVGVKITQTMVSPAGTAYGTIDYMYEGVCIHSATTGAIRGEPNPIAMLDRSYTWTEPHYQDIPNPDPKPEGTTAKISAGSYGGRPAWWEEKAQTHRQAIIEAVAQIIKD